MRISHRDFRRFNEAVAAMYRDALDVGAYESIVRTLPRLVPCTVSFFFCAQGKEVLANTCSQHEIVPALPSIPFEALITHPRCGPEMQGNVVKISDLLDKRAWHRREAYQACLPWFRNEDDLGADVPLAGGGMMRACVVRDTRSFREEDREIFSLLIPHMCVLLASHATGNTCEPLASLGLSPREQEVLYWVSEGKTNAEIGMILSIKKGTVGVHLEHIYAKLGVENRHGAARRALEKLYRFGGA